MTDILTIGALPVTAFGLGCGLAGLAALALTALLALRVCRVSMDAFARFAPLSVVLAFVMGRLLFVMGTPAMMTNPVRIIRFWEGGYSIIGAAIGFLLAAWLTEKLCGEKHHGLVSSASLAILPAIAILRLFEGMISIGRGREIVHPAFKFLGVTDAATGTLVHPVYRYEFVFALVLFAVFLYILLRHSREEAGRADFALSILTVFSAGQMVLENMKNDLHMVISFVPIQLAAELFMFLLPLIVWLVKVQKGSHPMKKSRMAIIWLVLAACIGLFVFMAFRTDRGAYKIVYYIVTMLCVSVMTLVNMTLCRLSRQG
ncbi:MAG: prolipoprotein diacylglyceryl transferase [Clostridia bacterium]|nr:prolipoprotein diacylglyceryl transferase [Clostridia bacterium]